MKVRRCIKILSNELDKGSDSRAKSGWSLCGPGEPLDLTRGPHYTLSEPEIPHESDVFGKIDTWMITVSVRPAPSLTARLAPR